MNQPANHRVRLRFYEKLNDRLPDDQQRCEFNYELTSPTTVRQLLESFRIPLTQVDLVLVDDEPVALSHTVQANQRIAVFPVLEPFHESPASRLRTRPVPPVRFVLDTPLEKLARLLRLAGFDSMWDSSATALDMIGASTQDKRILLSQERELLRNARNTHGYWIRATDPPAQFREILEEFALHRALRPFRRCMDCNGDLLAADESEVLEHVPFAVLVAFDDFWQCEKCLQVYWKGSHYERLAQLIETI